MMRLNFRFSIISAFIFTVSASTVFAQTPIPFVETKPYPIQSEARKQLTREYSKLHYGLDTWRLDNPRLIIIHYTGTDSDTDSLSTFKPASLGSSRPDITSGGSLNVGVHYLIARDGSVWSLLPETDMGRHAIGYNHTAIGIEMTGKSESSLTEEQLQSCAALVADILTRNVTISYLCGHHEYMDPSRAHLILYTELMPGYEPTVKSDPGATFMKRLRKTLVDNYSITLKD